jgi:hypothetical protein
MKSGDPCPKCGTTPRKHREPGTVILVDPTEAEWDLDVEDFDDDAEVWLCVDCGWNEQADDEDVVEEQMATLEWLIGRLGGGD